LSRARCNACAWKSETSSPLFLGILPPLDSQQKCNNYDRTGTLN
jgi:hypothetical protein